jgi:nicotinamide mononucleotide transporter
MVKEKFETWPLWFVVDAVYSVQFWRGGQYLTSILYIIFVAIAVGGWVRWKREAEAHSATAA